MICDPRSAPSIDASKPRALDQSDEYHTPLYAYLIQSHGSQGAAICDLRRHSTHQNQKLSTNQINAAHHCAYLIQSHRSQGTVICDLRPQSTHQNQELSTNQINTIHPYVHISSNHIGHKARLSATCDLGSTICALPSFD